MRLSLPRVIWALVLSAAVLSPAKIEDWSDIQGNTFKAEPIEALGPIAIFRTASGSGRRIPWRALSPADCVRFHEAMAKRAPLATSWSKATGSLTGNLIEKVRVRQDNELVKADLSARPEPILLAIFYVDNSDTKSWDMLGQCLTSFQELSKRYPGQIEGIQYGLNHNRDEHNSMAIQMKVPWLVVDHYEQTNLELLKRYSPGKGDYSVLVMTRDGVPIFSADSANVIREEDIAKIFADMAALLDLQRPNNPHSWPDRIHYLSAVHAASHLNDQAGPILVGNPLMAKGLRDRKIYRVEAKVEVGADGKATAVTLKDDGSIPAPMVTPLADAIKRSAAFVPAVDHGKFVAGSYDYLIEVAP